MADTTSQKRTAVLMDYSGSMSGLVRTTDGLITRWQLALMIFQWIFDEIGGNISLIPFSTKYEVLEVTNGDPEVVDRQVRGMMGRMNSTVFYDPLYEALTAGIYDQVIMVSDGQGNGRNVTAEMVHEALSQFPGRFEIIAVDLDKQRAPVYFDFLADLLYSFGKHYCFFPINSGSNRIDVEAGEAVRKITLTREEWVDQWAL